MKRIKTLSLLSSITAMAGVAVSLITPFETSAFADELISPGQDVPAVTITTNPDDLDTKHTITAQNPVASYGNPVYQSNKQWLLMQAKKQTQELLRFLLTVRLELIQIFHLRPPLILYPTVRLENIIPTLWAW